MMARPRPKLPRSISCSRMPQTRKSPSWAPAATLAPRSRARIRPRLSYPATDPWVLACGGTTIGSINGSSFTESVWNDTFGGNSGATGGGISVRFGVPSYQNGFPIPKRIKTGTVGRGIPDIAGNASPNSGYPEFVGGSSVGPTRGTSGGCTSLRRPDRPDQCHARSAGRIHQPTALHASPDSLSRRRKRIGCDRQFVRRSHRIPRDCWLECVHRLGQRHRNQAFGVLQNGS